MPEVETRADLVSLLILIMNRMLRGKLDVRRANCASMISKTILSSMPLESAAPGLSTVDPAGMTTDQALALIDQANSVSH